ncbi:MAG: hypothetical protein SFX73_09155 [Kofleriaceae bacterium]|nr:hypothetical protein [Kofleriaceae bacterium]
MTIAIRLTLSAGVVLAAACGDNSKACGEGTVEEDGLCVGEVVPPVTCAEGTLFDAATNTCVIDPASCADGTVFIRGRCQDPTAALTPDLEEGEEPNGRGIGGEASVTPAGVITLPAIGSPGVVLHGRIDAQPDRDGDGAPEPDFDAFQVDTTGPAVLEITADGVHGLAAGFSVTSELEDLERWSRIAINLTGDVAQRRLFLPMAGRYLIAIADARSLTLPQAIPDDENAEYYVTITQAAQPAPTALTLTEGMATRNGTLAPNQIDFLTTTIESARTDLVLSSPFAGTMGSMVVLIDGALAGVATEQKLLGSSEAAELTITGGVDGEVMTIVVEPAATTTSSPIDYALDIEAVPTLR